MTSTPSTEEPFALVAGKRCAIEHATAIPDWDWYVSWSPRNDSPNAEGPWCHWVHLARLILADPRTLEQMPEHHRPYEDPPDVYSGHHPDCTADPDTER